MTVDLCPCDVGLKQSPTDSAECFISLPAIGTGQIERCLCSTAFCSLISVLIIFKHAGLAPSFRCSQYEQKIDEFRGVL